MINWNSKLLDFFYFEISQDQKTQQNNILGVEKFVFRTFISLVCMNCICDLK